MEVLNVDREIANPSLQRPIRVGFVMHVMQVAGAEVLVKQIIERLQGTINATVFCLDGLGELGQQLIERGTPVVVLGRKAGLDRSLIGKMASEVVSRKIELLHAHQYTPFFYSALARAIGRCKCKIIFTEHGRHYPDLVPWKRRWINRLILGRFADIATACCDFSTQAVRTNEGISHTITLPNGVDLTQLPPRGSPAEQFQLRTRLGLCPSGRYATCVARFHPIKDHPTLLRGWKIVLEKVPDARLLLVGDGPEKSKSIQLAEDLGISHSVDFLGIRHDVADILRAADLFVLASVSEAASLTLLEAMASQCPSVLTAVGGNGEHVTDSVHGFLVPRADPVQLAESMVRLLLNPRLAQELGAAARERVIEHFDLTKVIDLYAAHYRHLCPAPHPQ